MNVFIGGSRAVSKLNTSILAKLDDFMQRGCTILIGDASGADRAVQQHFADHHYANVVVFCMAVCRNNVGGWPTRHIEAPSGRKDFSYYATKDLAMSQAADCGVMLWDAKSKGTLQNMLNLIGAGKRTLVYFAPARDFYVVANEQDLQTLLGRCETKDLEVAWRGLGLKTPLAQPHLPFAVSR